MHGSAHKLHVAGTRKARRFALRAQIWAFSPRGVGVLITKVKSSAFHSLLNTESQGEALQAQVPWESAGQSVSGDKFGI